MKKTKIHYRLLAFVLAVLLFATSAPWPTPEIKAAKTYAVPKAGDIATIATSEKLKISVAPRIMVFAL